MKQTANPKTQDTLHQRVHRLSDLFACRGAQRPDKEALEKALQLVRDVVHFDAATLYLLNKEKDKLEEAVSLDGRVELFRFLSVGIGEGMSGWTAQDRKPVLLSDRTTVSSFDPETEYATFLSLPLLIENDVVGVLNLGCKQERAYTDEDVTLLRIVSAYLAWSIDRLSLLERAANLSLQCDGIQQRLRRLSRDMPFAPRLAQIAPLPASVNHGINNALSVIVGNVECLLSEKAASDQKAQSRLRRIEKAALQIASLNRKVLEVSSVIQEVLASIKDIEGSDPDGGQQ